MLNNIFIMKENSSLTEYLINAKAFIHNITKEHQNSLENLIAEATSDCHDLESIFILIQAACNSQLICITRRKTI